MPRPVGSSPQLKWHNTLPQHFAGYQVSNSGTTPNRSTHKRQISSPNDEPTLNGAVYSQKQNAQKNSRSTILASPTKRHRSSEVLPNMTTPIKNPPAFGDIPSAGSGMQTPPPSSIAKRRGRPPKGATSNGVKAQESSRLSSPSKQNGQMHDISGFIPPIAINLDNNIPNIQNTQESFPISMSMAETYEFPDPNSPPAWSDLPSSVGDFDNDLPEIFGGNDPFYNLPNLDNTDPTTFSFQEDPDYFNCVDPNLLFSSRGTSDQSSQVGAWSDDLEHRLSPITDKPYQHQHNYRKRERELELKRQKMKERALKQKNLEISRLLAPRFGAYDPSALRHSVSEGILPQRREPNFKTSKLDVAINRALVRSITPPASRGGSVPKTPKVKTEVVFSISPSGRAKAETKIVYGSDTEVGMTPSELEELKTLEESQESDSSLDDPEPRGLAPDGKFYGLTRKQKGGEASTPKSKPRVGKLKATPMTEYTQNFDWSDTEEEPATPPSAPVKKLSQPASVAPNFQETTVGHSKINDQPALLSPRLSAPLDLGPPKEIHHQTASATSTIRRKNSPIANLGITEKGTQPGDESEAETVVDEEESLIVRPVSTPGDNSPEGNALEALKTAVANKRTNAEVSSFSKLPINSRPGSSSKHHVFSAGTHTVISRANRLPISHLFGRKSPLPPRKPLRRSRTLPDGGYTHTKRLLTSSHQADAGSNTSSTDEDTDVEELIRCICGMNEDGGRMMVQCDSCNGWLHLKCVGLHAKSLPERFHCPFCNGENQQPRNPIRRSSTLPYLSNRRSG